MGLVDGDISRDALGRRLTGTAARHAVFLLTGVAAIALVLGTARAQDANSAQAEKQDQAENTQTGQAPGNTTQLDQITVVSRTAETAINTMASVSHVDQEQLQRRMATTPNDVFFGVPGITMQADERRIGSSVNIRGLQDFGRVAVIVDGARQDFQRSDHGTQSTFWIDPELIQSADVIRGPVANTYGSGAIGGVVFFETKDAGDFLRPGETWALSAMGRYETNGQGWTTSTTGAYRFTENFDVLGNIVYRNYDDYKGGDGETVQGTGFDVLSGLIKTTIRPTENSELKLGWIGANDGWTEVSGGVPASDLDLKQNTFTGRYNITDDERSWLDLHVNLSYNKTSLDQTSLVALGRYDPSNGAPVVVPVGSQTTYDLGTIGIDLWNTSRFETGALAHELTFGGDWVSDDVETGGAIGGASFYTPSGDRDVGGAYVQEKLTWEWLQVVAGLRYDTYSLKGDDDTDNSGDRLSPRITVGISPFRNAGLEGLQFYGTYAEGYRSPSVTETLISGLHPAGVAFPFLPNPDLKPETAKTWEFGVNYAQEGIFRADDALRLKAAYFNNDVDNYIGLNSDIGAGDPGCPFIRGVPPIWVPGGYYLPVCAQYQNFANARIEGFELESFYDARWAFAGFSVSVIDGHTVSYAGVEADLDTIPSSQVTGQIGFRFFEEKLTIGGEVQYNGTPKGNATAEDYTLVNAFASYAPNEDYRIDFRADNIFDVNYVNPLNLSTVGTVYEPGVSLKIGLTARLGG
ncbi:TonB-dependent hemoglobin/transferrin/lactoferrin family receptor [Mesorhizobium sp. BAC0120]|uniref:TonB-dependent hemoglobin/transferrin/lactoferrin family receptor n=1 Tax=Mesorhizobium sp. BAC0120 TaxID=3090670 RepID=UPI00298CF220|nr:TonB-dependent hemoglobin/transferrin/lactoferrin family receptor [Mesorhizobium sp. BAC0120]MDW6025838.1 TonB-dependent hemoglobin/transferrin/lactoferrin family receptor [Mesorhizobium sp. BAC0120]